MACLEIASQIQNEGIIDSYSGSVKVGARHVSICQAGPFVNHSLDFVWHVLKIARKIANIGILNLYNHDIGLVTAVE